MSNLYKFIISDFYIKKNLLSEETCMKLNIKKIQLFREKNVFLIFLNLIEIVILVICFFSKIEI